MLDTDKTLSTVMSWKGYRRLGLVLSLVTGYFVFLDVRFWGGNLFCWDWMFYTGAATFMIAIAIAIGAVDKLEKAIVKLRINNTLILSEAELADLVGRMQAIGKRWRWYSGFGVFFLVMFSWLWAYWKAIEHQPGGWDGFVAQFKAGGAAINTYLATVTIVILVMAVCGFFAGTFLGAAAGHGAFAGVLAESNVKLRIRADHFDGAVGLKPIGDLYLFQAFLTAIPLIWFSTWWLLIPYYPELLCPHVDASNWAWPLVAMWLVTLIFTFKGFVKPMLQLRKRVLIEQIRLKQEDVPAIKQKIESLQTMSQQEGLTEAKRAALHQEIDAAARYLWSIEGMSAWPMDATTRRRYFSVNALVTVAPPVIELLAKYGGRDGATAGIWGLIRRATSLFN